MASFSETEWQPEYLPTDDKEKVRLVGIEFEAAIKNIADVPTEYQFLTEEYMDEKRIGYDDCLIEDFQNDSRQSFMEYKLEEAGIVVGGVGYDGGGKEFVSMPDSISLYQNGGSERLKKLVELLKQSTKADSASGTHINVSKLSSDVKTTWNNLYWFCMCFGPQLQKIFGRRSHWARIPLPKNFFTSTDTSCERLFEAPKKQPERASVQSKGSIIVDKGDRYEFRGPKATHDIDEVLAWAEICNNIVNVCADGYIQNVPFSDVLRGKYIRAYVNKIGKKSEDRRISPAERAMRISEIGYVKVTERDKIL